MSAYIDGYSRPLQERPREICDGLPSAVSGEGATLNQPHCRRRAPSASTPGKGGNGSYEG
eukprot:scaffold102691_cov35-Tisochrysis_lutea.AAC.1